MDCSGFIYQIFKLSGIKLPADECCADEERKPSFLKKHLKQYFDKTPFNVKDMGHLKVKDMHSGDLAYFIGSKGVYHIAIVLSNKEGGITLYQCLGNPNRDPDNMQ